MNNRGVDWVVGSLLLLAVGCGLAEGQQLGLNLDEVLSHQPSGESSPAPTKQPKQKNAKDDARASGDEQREIKRLWSVFNKAPDQAERAKTFAEILKVHPTAAAIIKPKLEQDCANQVTQYASALAAKVRPIYIDKLESLSQEQIDQIQLMRRMWMPYVREGGSRADFEASFIGPCLAAADLLLVKPEEITEESVASARARVVEFAGYVARCDAAMGVGPADPTKGKVSKTGLPYPPLDQPPGFQDNLRFLEQAIVLSETVAPPGAKRILHYDAEVAREIDVQESEFVLMANTIRMLVGQIAWKVDPLMCCCVRDHSNDRHDGKAEGHMSTVPGKHGFTDRARLWGTHASSEGAGGGRDGVNYLMGLSYGGGHTGPLYSAKRNLVGVGRRQGVYTSMYHTDASILHPTQASEGTLFLPPGFQASDVRGSTASAVAALLARGAIVEASAQLAKADDKKRDAYEDMLLRFFKGWVSAEEKYYFDGLRAVAETGDLFDLKRRIDRGRTKFGSLPRFADEIAPYTARIEAPDAVRVLQAGEAYHALAKIPSGTEGRLEKLATFAAQADGLPYAEGARGVLESAGGKKPWEWGPWDALFKQHPSAQNHGWPDEVW